MSTASAKVPKLPSARIHLWGWFNGLLTDEQAVQPILALGLLAEAGLKINWHRDGCFIRHPFRGEFKVFVKANCPYLEYNTGMELMKEVEEAQRRKMARLRAT